MATAAVPRAALAPAPAAGSARVTLLTAALGTFLVLVAFCLPTSTVLPLARALHAGPAAQTWFLTGMPVGLAALLLTAGSLADDHGRRRVFTLGTGGLLLSSALAAAAPGAVVFDAARVLEGAAGAAVIAPSLGLLGYAFPAGPERVRALGVWGAALGLGIAAGPLYAALLTGPLGPRAPYLGVAVLSAALLPVTRRLEESRSGTPRGLDPFGATALGAGMALLVAGLGEARGGWTRPATLALLGLGLLALAGFLLAEARVPAPMLDLALLRSPLFLASVVGALVTGLSVIGLMSYLPTVMQRLLGMGPLASAGVLALWSGLSVLASLQARRLAGRLSAAAQAALGLLLAGLGELALEVMGPGRSWLVLLPGLLLAGGGSGVLNAALARLAVASVPAARASLGSGANNTARYLGSSFGVAVTAAVVGAAPSLAAGARHAVVLAAALAFLGALAVLLLGRRGRSAA